MSKRAEEAALKAYPPMEKESHEIYLLRDGFINGYEQAEKDLALTWEDVPLIEELINEVHNEYPCGLSAQCFGEEVLQRFNESKNKK